MVDLFLGIIFFAIILVFFKLFHRYKVDNLQAIVINYLVAGSLGLSLSKENITPAGILQLDWIYYALIIGLFFVVVFNLLAKASQKVGLALATLANKISVLLPVVASFFLYGDTVSSTKIIGITIAVIGVIFSTLSKGKLNFDQRYLGLILIIFLGQGVADILFNYAQKNYVAQSHAPLFIAVIFIAAFIAGSFILAGQLFQKSKTFQLKSIFWGIAVGIPNYLTVFFFFRSLESDFMESSQVYPILNMGVIVVSALAGLLIFKEKLTSLNWAGLLLCIIAIGLISL